MSAHSINLESLWKWTSRIVAVVIIVAGFWGSATFATKGDLQAAQERAFTDTAQLAARVSAHDVALAETRTRLEYIQAALDRLEKQNAAILDRLPARTTNREK